MTSVRRGGTVASAALSLCLAAPMVPGAEIPTGTARLNLFQLTARADLVVHVRVREGALKFASVEVLEAMKGSPPAPRLRVAFRDFSRDRGLRIDPIVFPDGQEEILFLVPHAQAPRRKKDSDLFELLNAPQGRITVPAEGAGPILDAVRRLAALAAADPSSQLDGLHRILGGENLYLIEASLDEIGRLRAAAPSLYPALLHLLQSPSAAIRARSLRLLGQAFAAGDREGSAEAGDPARAALAGVIERARNDRDESVRVEAVMAIAAWPGRREVESELRAIAAQDPAQAVRYEAEKALYRGRQ